MTFAPNGSSRRRRPLRVHESAVVRSSLELTKKRGGKRHAGRRQMFLQMNAQLTIDNLGDYPPAIVAELRDLLLSGVTARPDPGRSNFYDVETTDRTFFIHASPDGDKVMLVAAWPRQLAPIA